MQQFFLLELHTCTIYLDYLAHCEILSLNQILAEPLILLMGSYKMHFVYISFKKKKKLIKKYRKYVGSRQKLILCIEYSWYVYGMHMYKFLSLSILNKINLSNRISSNKIGIFEYN